MLPWLPEQHHTEALLNLISTTGTTKQLAREQGKNFQRGPHVGFPSATFELFAEIELFLCSICT